MKNLCSHPFLLSLNDAARQTDNFETCKALLQKQQRQFQEYVDDCFNSETPAPKRFWFLKKASHELFRIHLEYSDRLKENHPDFYRFWKIMIEEAQHFLSAAIETLDFQRKCPAHMLAEAGHPFPVCNWTAQRSDLMEMITAVFHVDAVRLQDGSRPSFALFAKAIGDFVGVDFSHPHKEMQRIFDRKKNQTPFLNRIIANLKQKSSKRDGLKT
jgi:hypothetical protein